MDQRGISSSQKAIERKVIHSQSRSVIYSVYRFMKSESKDMSERKLQERVSEACSVSLSSVFRIIKEVSASTGETSTFSTPHKKRPRKKTKTELDDFDKCVVRRVIHEFHVIEGERPTLKGIQRALKDRINYNGSLFSLRQVVRNLGFRWKQAQNNRKVLIEKSDIRNLRVQYIRKIRQYRQEQRPIVYTDETFFHSSTSVTKIWSDNEKIGLKTPLNKGQRVVVLHAGGESGFVPNALLMFKSGTKRGDYHSDMNFDNYEKWIKEKLIPNLNKQSVLVIDNAPYHNVLINPPPTSSTKKADMIKWLRERNIPFNPSLLKPELYELIKHYKPTYKTYKIDAIMAEHGHAVLRLPPYHPDLNPIEMIWATVKDYIKKKNVNFSVDSVINLATEKFVSISAADWKSRCEHVKKAENEYMRSDEAIDCATDRLVINYTAENSSSDDASCDNDGDGDSEGEISGIEVLNSA